MDLEGMCIYHQTQSLGPHAGTTKYATVNIIHTSLCATSNPISPASLLALVVVRPVHNRTVDNDHSLPSTLPPLLVTRRYHRGKNGRTASGIRYGHSIMWKKSCINATKSNDTLFELRIPGLNLFSIKTFASQIHLSARWREHQLMFDHIFATDSDLKE